MDTLQTFFCLRVLRDATITLGMTTQDFSRLQREKISAAMYRARRMRPYLGRAFARISWWAVHHIPTMGITPNYGIGVRPSTLDRWSVEEIATAICHEVEHPLLRHHQIPAGYSPAEWNYATDRVINGGLNEDPRCVWPREIVPYLPSDIGMAVGHTAEEYYQEAQRQEEERRQAAEQAAQEEEASGDGAEQGEDEGEDDSGAEPGEADEDGEGAPGADEDAQDAKDEDGEGDAEDAQDDAGGDGDGEGDDGSEDAEDDHAAEDTTVPPGCGAGAGNPQGWEAEVDALIGEMSEQERSILDRAVAQEMEAHAAQQGTGSIPGHLLRWTGDVLAPPQVRWQDKLRRCVQRGTSAVGSTRKNYRQGHRLQGAIGWGGGRPVLAGRKAEEPRVLVAVDTSMSMGSDEVGATLAELSGILRVARRNTTFVAIDCAIHSWAPVRHWKQAAALVRGGGGTDFRPVFDEVAKRKAYDIVIFITDGGGPAPETSPDIPVIWALVGPYKQRPYSPRTYQPVSWGECIEVC